MAFTHSRLTDVFVSGFDLTQYFNSYSYNGSADTAETSTFGLTSKTYIPGLKDATLTLEGLYESATNADVDLLNTALGNATAQIVTIFPQGDTLGLDGLGFSGFATNLSIPADLSQAVMISADLQSNVGFEAGYSLHALGAEVSTGNGTSHDNLAATSNGAASYLHVTAFSGTDCTIVVADSADDSSFATIITHTEVTGANAKERVAITGNVRRYTRYTLSGTFSSITFVLLLCRL